MLGGVRPRASERGSVGHEMEFKLLGPLEAREGPTPVRLAGRKQRALLARLLLDVNRTVATERLIDDLWGEEVPETAPKMVQIYVSQLRKLLPDGTLATRPPGYAIELDPQSIDVMRFQQLRAEGEAAHAAGHTELAAQRLGEALALWRGDPLAEFSEPFARTEAARLEELYLACLEARIDADLDRGRHAALAGELEALVGRYPLREGFRAQQLLALYRAGRQSDALAAYQAVRALLVTQVGLEPSARLKALERRILRQDADLELPAPPQRPAGTAPDVRYVTSGDVSIAYQVVGSGATDLVLVQGWVCSFQPGWERREIASFYEGVAALGRLVLFDKRGTGLSDRVSGIAALEERMDDVRAVLGAVGSKRAVLLGISEGGPMVTLFAATYPERTAGIVLMGSFARRLWAPDYPIGLRREDAWWNGASPEEWGLPMARRFVDERAPSVAGDEETYRWYASYLVRGASPGAAVQLARMNAEIDVRHVLPSIHVPTLVLYRRGEYLRAPARYMGERIPGARVVALPGSDHLPWEGAQDDVLREIGSFVECLDVETAPDRVLATVLVIEADGTAEACDAVRADVARFRGTEVTLTDDTLVATFDGPARAIRCASTLLARARSVGRRARAGLHTGECELVGDVVAGIPVSVAGSLKERAEPGEVLVSSTVRDLVAGSGLVFSERGQMQLRVDGAPDCWRVYAVAA
jgi:DNA-binding SARP family transcriptional activator/pimeloyl-ACP methyl ester carboxylesterase